MERSGEIQRGQKRRQESEPSSEESSFEENELPQPQRKRQRRNTNGQRPTSTPGAINTGPNLEAVLERQNYDKHFKTIILEYKMRFRGILDVDQEGMEASIQTELDQVLDDARDRAWDPTSDFIKVTLTNKNFPGGDLSVPFIRLDEFGAQTLAKMVSRIVQSNQSFEIDHPFDMKLEIQVDTNTDNKNESPRE